MKIKNKISEKSYEIREKSGKNQGISWDKKVGTLTSKNTTFPASRSVKRQSEAQTEHYHLRGCARFCTTRHKHSHDFNQPMFVFVFSLQQYPEDPAEFKPLTEDE